MPIAEDSAGGSPVPIPTNLTTNLTGEATGSGTLDYTTGDIDIAVTVVDNGHNHILENITDVQVNNAISGQVLKYNGNVWVNGTDENAGITALVQDLTPELGGNLNLNNRNITGTGNIAITGTIDGRDVSADGTKLDSIESGATADQTAAQIKTAYESNTNTNNFADADVSKLGGIEPGATADQTAAQIKTAYESNSNTNAFTDADHTKLDGIETAADVTDTTNVVASLTAGTNVTISAGGVISSTASGGLAHVVDDTTPELGGNLSLNSHDITGTGNLNFTGNVTLSGTVDGRDVAADGTKLDGIEASADVTDTANVTAAGALMDSELTDLAGVKGVTISTLQIKPSEGAFANGDKTKLDGIESSADVTDTANVTAAGALMDSEVTNLAQVKAFDSSDYATAAQGTTADAALPKAGGTMTGDILFNDGVKAKYGTSSDLQIYHDGSNSIIDDSGTGNLYIRSNDVLIDKYTGERMIRAVADGAVTLYHNNVEKLATTTNGALVTNATNISMDGSANGQFKVQGSGYGFAIALDADAANLYTNSSGRDLVFGVDETEVARVTPTGIGIGTTSPNHELHIESTSPTIRLVDTDANNTLDITQSGSACYVDFDNTVRFRNLANAERLRIDTGGIDVTGTVLADKMEVQGTSGTQQWLAGSSTNYKEIYAYDNSTFYDRLNGGNCTNYQWGVYNNIPIYTITNNSIKTTLLGNGNFGVGTTAPAYKIDARGAANTDVAIQVKASGTGDVDAELRLDAADTGEALVRFARDGTTRAIAEYTNADEWNFTTYNDDKIDFQPNSTNVLRLTDDNIYAYKTVNVTGGVTVSTNLNVGNATPAGGGTIESHVQSSSTPALITYSGSSSLRTHISFENFNGQVGKINTAGTQTFYVTSSDYRLKTDIQPMQGSIDRVKALNPCNFEWVNDGGRVDGFIAHEVQDVVPEAIVGEKDAMQDQEYVQSEATGDIYTPAVKATYETIQVELTPAVDAVYETVTVEISPAVEATYDEDGNELTPAIEAITEEQEQLVTPAVDATYEEQQQELTPAVDEVIHSSDVVEPDELEEGQRWRETTEKVMATRQVPDYQGIDQSKIVPLLTSALQDAIAKIEALETRLTALES